MFDLKLFCFDIYFSRIFFPDGRLYLKIVFCRFLDQKLLSMCTLKRVFSLFTKVFPILGKNLHLNGKILHKLYFYEVKLIYLVVLPKIIKVDV